MGERRISPNLAHLAPSWLAQGQLLYVAEAMSAAGAQCSSTYAESATIAMTKLAPVRALLRTRSKSPFSGPLVTVLLLAVLPCSLGMQAAHLSVTQQQIKVCTAPWWALLLLLGAKVLHGVCTKLGVLKVGLQRGGLWVGSQAGQVWKLLQLCFGELLPCSVLVSDTMCTGFIKPLGGLQALQ